MTHFKKQEHIPDSSTRTAGRIQLQPTHQEQKERLVITTVLNSWLREAELFTTNWLYCLCIEYTTQDFNQYIKIVQPSKLWLIFY